MTSNTVRDKLVGSVLDLAADGKSNKPFGDWYNTIDGTTNAFAARPVVGGHFALVCPDPLSFRTPGRSDTFV